MTLLEAAKYYRNRNLWSQGGDGEPFSPNRTREADQAIEAAAQSAPAPGPATEAMRRYVEAHRRTFLDAPTVRVPVNLADAFLAEHNRPAPTRDEER